MTNKAIQKIKDLRKETWVSQQDIANYIWVSRLTYLNIENQKRKLKEKEIKKIAEFFEKPLSYFIELENKITKDDILKDKNYKLKQLILYISEKTQDIPSFGKTVLNKLLYFSDFDYYEWAFETITWTNYRKLPFWPVPENITEVLEEMQKAWEIAIKETIYHNYPQQKIIPLKKANLKFLYKLDKEIRKETPFSDLPIPLKIVDDVLNKFRYHTASQISEWSHKDTPYRACKNVWEHLRPWLAFYRSEPFIVNPHNL